MIFIKVFLHLQPTPTPKRPNEEDSDSDEDQAKASKYRRLTKSKSDYLLYGTSNVLPKEPIITDKEREDILRFVETEATEVKFFIILMFLCINL